MISTAEIVKIPREIYDHTDGFHKAAFDVLIRRGIWEITDDETAE